MERCVASFTDAWIETDDMITVTGNAAVASFTDAWIETVHLAKIVVSNWSHLLQMRGLKHNNSQYTDFANGSHLLQMRGLKLF